MAIESQTIFRSFANITKMTYSCSCEINNLLKSCSRAYKMMILGLAFLKILNNFVVPFSLVVAIGMN